MKKYLVLLSMVLLLAGLFAARKAVVIGNSTYSPYLNDLSNPVNDALLLQKTLTNTGFQVSLLTDASRRQIRDLVQEVSQELKESDELFFYYSGHGIQVNGVNYLLPIGADIQDEIDCEDEAISANWMLGKLSAAGTVIFILDACRDNPFLRTKSSSSKGLAVMKTLSGKNQIIVYATEENQLAQDGSGGNSPFAEVLARHIDSSEQKFQEMLPSIKREVLAKTNNAQSPTAYGILLNDFYFREPKANDSQPQGILYSSFTTEEPYLSFQYPQGWFIEESGHEISIYLRNGDEDPVIIFDLAEDLPNPDQGFAAWAKAYLIMLLEEEDMIYSIQSEEGGRAFGFEQFRCQMLASERGESRRYDILMLNLGGEVLLIAYLVEPQAYDRYHSGFENILQTLRIDPGYLARLQSSREDTATGYSIENYYPPWWEDRADADFLLVNGSGTSTSESSSLDRAKASALFALPQELEYELKYWIKNFQEEAAINDPVLLSSSALLVSSVLSLDYSDWNFGNTETRRVNIDGDIMYNSYIQLKIPRSTYLGNLCKAISRDPILYARMKKSATFLEIEKAYRSK